MDLVAERKSVVDHRIDPQTEEYLKRMLSVDSVPEEIKEAYRKANFCLSRLSLGGQWKPQELALLVLSSGYDPDPKKKAAPAPPRKARKPQPARSLMPDG